MEELEEKQRELFCLDQRNAVTMCSLNNKLTLWVEIKWKCFCFSMSICKDQFVCIFLPIKWISFIRIQVFLCKTAALLYCVLSKQTFQVIDKLCLFVYHCDTPNICKIHHQETETTVPLLLSVKFKHKEDTVNLMLVMRVLWDEDNLWRQWRWQGTRIRVLILGLD